MSKFNKRRAADTQNISGHAAFSMTDRDRLITQVLTSFFGEPKYYGDNSAALLATLGKVVRDDPAFVAQLGLFARTRFHMRSVSHMVGAVLAHEPAGKPYTREYVRRACLRADDMTEILAAYLHLYGKPIPNALKKGLADALRGFDEYALAKYDRDGAVKLRDLLQLCHPAPKSRAQEGLWKRTLERSLEIPVTWETQLSAHGNNRETWEKLIEENALGYLAMLRNLRNILNAGVGNLDKVYKRLADPGRVRKARVLPFRFYAAYREVHGTPRCNSRTVAALEAALEASVQSIPRLPGKTLIAIDVSGSMGAMVSARSKVSCRDIACLIGAMANHICEEAHIVTFDTRVRAFAMPADGSILQNANRMAANGGGTDLHLPFRYLADNKLRVDRVIVLSDNEVNRGSQAVQRDADDCRARLNRDMWVHAIDLQGYGTQQFAGGRTNLIAGWSERVLEFIGLAERGAGSLAREIGALELESAS